MNFTINRKQLKAGLDSVKTAFGLKRDQNSIYATSIKIVAGGDKVSFITTNGETYFKWTAPEGVTVAGDGSCVANAEKILQGAGYMTSDEVSFEYANDILYVRGGKVTLEVRTVDSNKLADVPEHVTPIKLPFDSTDLFSKITHTMGRDPALPKMLGVLMDFKTAEGSKTVTLRSAQRNRASRVVQNFESEEDVNLRIVLPCFVADEASKRRLMSLGVDKKTLVAKFDSLVITTALPEDIFIDGDQAFGRSVSGTPLRFSYKELSEAVTFIKSVSDKRNRRAKFIVNGGQVETSALTDTGNSKMVIGCESPDSAAFAFNSEYLADLLSSVEQEQVDLTVTNHVIAYKEGDYQFVMSLYRMQEAQE